MILPAVAEIIVVKLHLPLNTLVDRKFLFVFAESGYVN